MKKVVWTLAMLALTCGAASAQDVNEPAQQAPEECQPVDFCGAGFRSSSR